MTSYTYDGAGNRRTQEVHKGLEAVATVYNYNAQNRLTATIASNGIQTRYLYDKNGNLVSRSAGKIKSIRAGELTKEDLPDFDLAIRRGSDNGTGSENLTTYTYDHYNCLTGTKSENTTAAYGYNAQGYRWRRR